VGRPSLALAGSLAGACGAWLLYSSLALGRSWAPRLGQRAATLARAGSALLGPVGVGARQLALGSLGALAAGAALAYVVFAAPLPSLAAGLLAAALPPAAFRARHQRQLAEAQDAWPQLIEKVRIYTGAAGRSIPQALFDAGRHAPEPLRSAFAAAEREWLITTDFSRTVSLLKSLLADPTADAACETLLVAHEVGGSQVDGRLAALVEDRVQDLEGRKDARAKQAGVRFARRFVLAVPAGMALAGLMIGPGRQAYATPAGQLALAGGVAAVAVCWAWAGRLLRLPGGERVFAE